MMNMDRRTWLKAGGALALSGAGLLHAPQARAQGQANPPAGVRALLFDVFGTVVDWRNGVAREAERILKPMGYALDWLAFADAWRHEYQPALEEVRSGRVPFAKLDVLHRRMLDKVKPRFGLDKLDEATLAELNLAWHRLDAWKDVGPGFARLRTQIHAVPLLERQHRHHGRHRAAQRSALARGPRFRDRPGFQAEAARLSRPRPRRSTSSRPNA